MGPLIDQEEREMRNAGALNRKDAKGKVEEEEASQTTGGVVDLGNGEEKKKNGEEIEYTRNQKISFVLNILISLNSGVAFGLFNPILYEYVSGMGVSGTFYSNLGLAYGLAAIASNLVVAFCGNQGWFPRFKILHLISLVLTLIAGLMFSVVGNPYLVLGSKILTGLCSYAQCSSKVYVSAMTTPANRTEHQSRLTTYTFMSNFVTPLLSICFLYIDSGTEVLPMNKFTLTGWFLVVNSIVLIVLTGVYFEEPKKPMPVSGGSDADKEEEEKVEMEEEEKELEVKITPTRAAGGRLRKEEGFFAGFPWAVFFLTMYGRFLQYFGDGVFQTAAPVVLQEDLKLGSTLNIDVLFLIYGSCYYIFCLPCAWAIKKYGFRTLILVGSSGLALSFLLTVQFTSGATIRQEGNAFYVYCVQIVIGSIMTAFGCVLLAQACSSLLSMCVGKQKQQSFAMGLYILMGFFGRMIGTYWGGLDKYVGGFNTIFLVSLGVAMTGFIAFAIGYRKLDETVYSKRH
eukprot:Nk52_evm14s312 gene=Nk52_evmTU14s312